jgi:hypothetical protein
MSLNLLTLDADDALRLLAAVVTEHGTTYRANDGNNGQGGACYLAANIESGWSQTHDTENLVAVCIVGKVFARLGILRALIGESGDQFGTCAPEGDGPNIFGNAEAMGVTFSIDAQRVLRAAQEEQDGGETWGRALTAAIREFRRIADFDGPVGLLAAYDALDGS